MTAPSPTTPSLSWPPPALESIHGKLWPTIAVLAFADVVLVPPLLLSLGTHQPIGSLGPFGDAFWVPLATTFLGTLILVAGLWRLARLLRGARAAARAGHARRTILMVLADAPRDTGFLLTGGRACASLGPTERDTILAARIVTAGLSLAAVLLAPAGLSFSILLGRLTIAGGIYLWRLTLWLPLALCAGAVLSAGAARALAASAKRKGAGAGAADGALRTAVTEWNATLSAQRPDRASRVGKPARPRVFGLGAAGALVLAVLVVIPVAALVVAGTIGSILASIATPNLSNTRARFAAAEPLRRFVLEPDTSISPEAAGQALHALLSVGPRNAEQRTPELTPVRSYAEPWFPADSARAPSLRGASWVDSLFARPARTAAQSAYVRRMAAHPAHAEFHTVARAQVADVLGTRYALPFGPGVTMINLPIPSFGSIRLGARAHLARAALALSDGRPAQAEQGVREVISVGFRLIDDGPTLMDNLIGAVLVGMGGDALEDFYKSTGRTREAETLEWVRAEARKAAERAVSGEARWTAEAGFRALPGIVLDSTQARGLRWEFFGWTSVFAPCANIKALAFGPGEDYDQWLESARAGLVRRPSDEALLDLMLRGPFGTGRCLSLWGGLRTMGQMR